MSVCREVKSYTKQKDPGSFRAISALKGPGSYTIFFQQAVLWTERLQQRNARLGAGLAGGSVPDAGLHLADVGAAQQQHAQTALADAAADGVGQLTVQHGLVEGPAMVSCLSMLSGLTRMPMLLSS